MISNFSCSVQRSQDGGENAVSVGLKKAWYKTYMLRNKKNISCQVNSTLKTQISTPQKRAVLGMTELKI